MGNSSDRSAHLLRRLYEEVVPAGIQHIAKGFLMAGCVTVQLVRTVTKMGIMRQKNMGEIPRWIVRGRECQYQEHISQYKLLLYGGRRDKMKKSNVDVLSGWAGQEAK